MEAGHEDDVPRGLEADDALLLALVLDGSSRFFLGDLRGAALTPSTRRLDGRSIASDAESRTLAVAAARASLSSASLAESHRAGATSRSRNCSTSGRPAEERWRSSARVKFSNEFSLHRIHPSQPALCGHCQEGDVIIRAS